MWQMLRFTTIRAQYRANLVCRMPSFKGPMLHATFGPALREMTCLHGESMWEPCPSIDRCVFGEVYDQASILRDYCIMTPEPDERTEFAAGDLISLRMNVIGVGRLRLPWLFGALVRLGSRGLTPERHPFSIVSLTSENRDGSSKTIELAGSGIGQQIDELDAGLLIERQAPRSSAILHFRTPTQLRERKRLIVEPNGEFLFKRILKRVWQVAETCCNWSPDGFDARPLLQEARAIETSIFDISTYHDSRESRSQKTTQSISGILGSVRLDSISPSIWPYLVTATRLHIGKGIHFGMGLYDIESL